MSQLSYPFPTAPLSLRTGALVEANVELNTKEPPPRRGLFLHGNPGTLLDFRDVLPLVKEQLSVAAIDLPGFGKSPSPPAPKRSLRLEALAEHVVAVMDALAWHEPLVLVGHSHGGAVAQTVASRHPERVAGLVLLASLGFPEPSTYRMLSLPGGKTLLALLGKLFGTRVPEWAMRRLLRATMKGLFAPELVPEERIDRQLALFGNRPEVLVHMVELAQGRPGEQLLRAAPGISCPTLFLHGADDAIVGVETARNIHEAILRAGGQSEFRILAGAGHMFMEFQGAEIARNIVEFCDSLPASSPAPRRRLHPGAAAGQRGGGGHFSH